MGNGFEMKIMVKSHAIEMIFKSWGPFSISNIISTSIANPASIWVEFGWVAKIGAPKNSLTKRNTYLQRLVCQIRQIILQLEHGFYNKSLRKEAPLTRWTLFPLLFFSRSALIRGASFRGDFLQNPYFSQFKDLWRLSLASFRGSLFPRDTLMLLC